MVDRSRFLQVAREEMQKHTFDTFVENPPPIARGGRGVVVSGCPGCRKRLQSLNQFIEHLEIDVMPLIVDRVIAE
jgi:hypothetical protein